MGLQVDRRLSRRVIVLAIAAGAASGVGCDGPMDPTAARLGEPFELRVGATAVIDGGVGIKFERTLSDSRCPLDAVCIAAGDAVIEVAVAIGDQSHRYELHTVAAGSELAIPGFVIQLTNLQPYPRAARPTPSESYVATLIVRARGT